MAQQEQRRTRRSNPPAISNAPNATSIQQQPSPASQVEPASHILAPARQTKALSSTISASAADAGMQLPGFGEVATRADGDKEMSPFVPGLAERVKSGGRRNPNSAKGSDLVLKSPKKRAVRKKKGVEDLRGEVVSADLGTPRHQIGEEVTFSAAQKQKDNEPSHEGEMSIEGLQPQQPLVGLEGLKRRRSLGDALTPPPQKRFRSSSEAQGTRASEEVPQSLLPQQRMPPHVAANPDMHPPNGLVPQHPAPAAPFFSPYPAAMWKPLYLPTMAAMSSNGPFSHHNYTRIAAAPVGATSIVPRSHSLHQALSNSKPNPLVAFPRERTIVSTAQQHRSPPQHRPRGMTVESGDGRIFIFRSPSREPEPGSSPGALALTSSPVDSVFSSTGEGVSSRSGQDIESFDAQDDEQYATAATETETSPAANIHEITTALPSPLPSTEDAKFIAQTKEALRQQSGVQNRTIARRQAKRILGLLDVARAPDDTEALFCSNEETKKYLQPGLFFAGPIFVDGAQPMPLDTVANFIDEYYDDKAKVAIQDSSTREDNGRTAVREVTIGQLRERFSHPKPARILLWNCLELHTHVSDGIRPTFLRTEDCRLLTKVKIPGSEDAASRRGFEPGWKEVETWALMAQAGSLTEPHQDSHGYNTFITVNQGVMGYGWLANPTAADRKAWRADPFKFTCDKWRYVIVRPGRTVYFPSGTVHFVFRLAPAIDTLAYGGHVLRCSRIVNWVKTLIEGMASPEITNEPISVSAPAYLERVANFVKQARRMGREDLWGGTQAIVEFLRLKDEFMSMKPPKP